MTVKLTAAISSETVRDTLRNRRLNPNALKFSVEMDNITYHSPNSKFALIVSLDAKHGLEQTVENVTTTPEDPTVTEGALDVDSDNSGRFTWVKWAAAKFLNTPVVSNVPITQSKLFGDVEAWTNTIAFSQLDNDFDITELRQLIAYTFNTNAQPTSLEWDPNTVLSDNITISTDTESSSTGSSGSGFAFATATCAVWIVALLVLLNVFFI